jgi:XapX domain-containing protein
MKTALGLSVGFLLGFVCRYFDIPVPSPPKLVGAFLVVAVTFGYMAADRVLTPAGHKTTIVQTLHSEASETVNR